jgi:putative peptidoglycan lipid II flippase
MSIENAARAISGRWKRLTAGSINFRIFSAFVTVGGLTVGVKMAAMIKEVIVAASFGTGDALEALIIALLLPSFIINVVAVSFNAALIPIYIQVRENEGHASTQRLFSTVMVLAIALLIIVTVLLAIVGRYALPLLGSGFEPAKLAMTQKLFYICLPIIVIDGLTTVWESVIQAQERFVLTSISYIVIPIASIAALFGLGVRWGIYALAFGICIGHLLRLCLLGWGLKRQSLSLSPRWYGVNPALRQVIGQYLPAVGGALIMTSTLLVDQTMAAGLDPGSVAALNYGNKIVTLVNSIGTMALGTAVLPYFSKLAAVGDWASLRRTLKTYSMLTLAATIPLTFFLYLFSGMIVRLVFQRGAFTQADTLLVAQVQAMYVLQIPFYALVILFVRLISSLRSNFVLMWETIINFTVNIVLDYVLMKIMGVAGIALSTTVVYIFSLCFLSTMAYRILRRIEVQSCV